MTIPTNILHPNKRSAIIGKIFYALWSRIASGYLSNFT